MRRMTILISALVLGLAMTTLPGLASDNKVESSLSQQHLDNLNLLLNLSRAGISIFFFKLAFLNRLNSITFPS